MNQSDARHTQPHDITGLHASAVFSAERLKQLKFNDNTQECYFTYATGSRLFVTRVKDKKFTGGACSHTQSLVSCVTSTLRGAVGGWLLVGDASSGLSMMLYKEDKETGPRSLECKANSDRRALDTVIACEGVVADKVHPGGAVCVSLSLIGSDSQGCVCVFSFDGLRMRLQGCVQRPSPIVLWRRMCTNTHTVCAVGADEQGGVCLAYPLQTSLLSVCVPLVSLIRQLPHRLGVPPSHQPVRPEVVSVLAREREAGGMVLGACGVLFPFLSAPVQLPLLSCLEATPEAVCHMTAYACSGEMFFPVKSRA
eukprot:GHVR01013199.1.p1 GENE.GHVR01013199.1~~GHVR01013199.1.p1  ORF type:complete len:310 (-),score=105.35 GHVR01013199.1:191-1120(-)